MSSGPNGGARRENFFFSLLSAFHFSHSTFSPSHWSPVLRSTVKCRQSKFKRILSNHHYVCFFNTAEGGRVTHFIPHLLCAFVPFACLPTVALREGGLPIHRLTYSPIFVQHPDIRQLPKGFRIIESVAHDKHVRYNKSAVVRFDCHLPAGRLVKQGAGFKRCRPA
jgi:hypothetical protein